jgi:AcrR family transcriptional regulator
MAGNSPDRTSHAPSSTNTTSGELIEEAALRLLRRNGVLSGLNLKEVAGEAGVHRGLVYHYFGSRRALLRSTLQHETRRRLRGIGSGYKLPFLPRIRHLFEAILAEKEAVDLVALLVLDGDEEIRTLPMHHRAIEALEDDICHGELREVDPRVLHTLLASLVYGYVSHREAFAREVGVDVKELDRKILDATEQIFAGFRPNPESGTS